LTSAWSEPFELILREQAVGRHEGDSLDEGLRDQHAVERIAVASWKVGHPERVASGDLENLGPGGGKAGRNEVTRNDWQRQLAKLVLDDDFPPARGRTGRGE